MYTSSTPGQTHRNYDHIPTHLYCTSCTSQVLHTLQEVIRLVTPDLELATLSKKITMTGKYINYSECCNCSEAWEFCADTRIDEPRLIPCCEYYKNLSVSPRRREGEAFLLILKGVFACRT